jgi:hypothetical protein
VPRRAAPCLCRGAAAGGRQITFFSITLTTSRSGGGGRPIFQEHPRIANNSHCFNHHLALNAACVYKTRCIARCGDADDHSNLCPFAGTDRQLRRSVSCSVPGRDALPEVQGFINGSAWIAVRW